MELITIAAPRQVLVMVVITVVTKPNTPTTVGNISIPRTIKDNGGEGREPALSRSGNERSTMRLNNSSTMEQARIVRGTAAAVMEDDRKNCTWIPRRAST